jgi:hypothetical protein
MLQELGASGFSSHEHWTHKDTSHTLFKKLVLLAKFTPSQTKDTFIHAAHQYCTEVVYYSYFVSQKLLQDYTLACRLFV